MRVALGAVHLVEARERVDPGVVAVRPDDAERVVAHGRDVLDARRREGVRRGLYVAVFWQLCYALQAYVYSYMWPQHIDDYDQLKLNFHKHLYPIVADSQRKQEDIDKDIQKST